MGIVTPDVRLIRTLPDGALVLARPIRHDDDVALSEGIKRLSPAGQVHRFLQHRESFTPQELRYLTHCDMVDHVAMMLVVIDAEGRELDRVGVARSVRDKEDSQLAEVAIVLVDEWQHRGGGIVLIMALALAAWQRGIRRWQAFFLETNPAIRKLLAHAGRLVNERRLGHGMVETCHELRPPAPGW